MLGAAAATLGLLAGGGLSSAAGGEEEDSLDSLRGPAGVLWDRVHKQFRLRGGLAYLNNGSLGPCPVQVVQAAIQAWRSLEENPADMAYGPLLEKMEAARTRAAGFLGCATEELAVTGNTTEGMNAVAQGIRLEAGDRILTTDQEHPGGLAGWGYRQKHEGVPVDLAALPTPPASPEAIVESIQRGLTKATRVISVSHVTYTTGLRMPIEAIASLARANGALLVVDGAQAPGVLDVDVTRLGCDAYATSAHKWMLAPKGTGLLYVRKESQERIAPLLLQHGYRSYTASTGTRNVPALIGLGAAVEFLQRLGKIDIERRALTLRTHLYEVLQTLPGIQVVSPPPGDLASSLLTFTLPNGKQPAAVAKTLAEEYGVIVRVMSHGNVQGIRVSTHIYNSEADLDRLVSSLRKGLGK